MRIYRFDPEVGIPIDRFGSRFTIGALTGNDSRVRVQIMHLPPAGLIGRHETVLRQLFAVVAGSGWVSGQDSRRRQIHSGYGAVWEEGEPHEAGSETGMTAVSVEGRFEMWATAVTQDIVVVDYDPAWPDWFERLRRRLWPAVSDVALRVEHVGSTSVPDLAAKPIIDMDIVVAGEDRVRAVIDRLTDVGYRWRGDLGVTGRQAFAAPFDSDLPAHHLYLVVENNRAHLDHWLLRDLLREDAEARDAYAALKRANVELADGDMDSYVAAKAAFVAELLTRARRQRGLPSATYWTPE